MDSATIFAVGGEVVEVLAQSLSIGWGSKRVLSKQDLALDLENWNFRVPIVGPSGCGKSTLLYALSGFMRLQEGSVNWTFGDGSHAFWDGNSGRSGIDTRTLRQRTFSLAFQDSALLPHLSVYENFLYPIELAREKSDFGVVDIPAHIDQILRRVLSSREKSEDILAKYPGELSGGQKRRIAIAQSMMTEPQFLFLDEPAGGLDPVTKTSVMEKIGNWVNEGQSQRQRAVFWVTHHLDEAEFKDCKSVLKFETTTDDDESYCLKTVPVEQVII